MLRWEKESVCAQLRVDVRECVRVCVWVGGIEEVFGLTASYRFEWFNLNLLQNYFLPNAQKEREKEKMVKKLKKITLDTNKLFFC